MEKQIILPENIELTEEVKTLYKDKDGKYYLSKEEAHIWDLKSTIFNQEQLIERNRKYHNGTLLQLGKAKHVIDLMKIMLIGAEKQDFVIYPSSEKTPNYLDIIQHKIKEYENS